MYLPETNVLVTRFPSPGSVAEVIDFMPIDVAAAEPDHRHQIVRQLCVVRGSARFKGECFPTFDYARARHVLVIGPDSAIFSSRGERLGLTAPVPVVPQNPIRAHAASQ